MSAIGAGVDESGQVKLTPADGAIEQELDGEHVPLLTDYWKTVGHVRSPEG